MLIWLKVESLLNWCDNVTRNLNKVPKLKFKIHNKCNCLIRKKNCFSSARFDHLPVEEQVLKYQSRNLLRSKVYKFGCRVFGESKGRSRVIVAPPMEKCSRRETQNTLQSSTSSLQTYSTALPTSESIEEIQKELKQYTEKGDIYNDWLRERKIFRSDLDNMGLNDMWLSRKPDKTPIEQRVLQRLLRDKYPRLATPEVPT